MTVVRAVERVEGVHLVFMAARHASELRRRPRWKPRGAARAIRHEEWVPYERRADWLLDADVGVSAHRDDVETRFAFHRVLDYLWAGLPVLCTAGDALADEVQRLDLGAALRRATWTAGGRRSKRWSATRRAGKPAAAGPATWRGPPGSASPARCSPSARRRGARPTSRPGGPLRPTHDGVYRGAGWAHSRGASGDRDRGIVAALSTATTADRAGLAPPL